MPIPEATITRSPQPASGVAGYRPSEPNLEGIVGAGRAMQDAANTVAQTNARQDEIVAQAAANTLASRSLDLNKEFSQVKEGGAVGPQFVEGFTKKFTDLKDDVRQGLQSPYQQKVFDQHAEVADLRFKAALYGHQSQETDKFNHNTWRDTIDGARGQIFANMDDPLATADALAKMDWAINQMADNEGWSDETRKVTKDRYLAAVSVDALSVMISQPQNLGKAISLMGQRLGVGQDPKLTGNLFVDHLKPNELVQLYSHAMTVLDQGKSAVRGELQAKTRDFQAFASGVGLSWSGDPSALAPSLGEYQAAFGEAGQRLWRDNVGVFIEQAQATKTLSTASAADRQEIIKRAEPTGVEGAAARIETQRNLMQANASIEKALKEDPAGYVSLSSPRVKEARAAYQKDPTQFDRYVNETLSEQKRMGAPHPKPLLAGEAAAIAQSFFDNPPEKAADLVSSLEKQYGKNFPLVYKQLAQDAKMPPSALVIPNMQDAGSRARLASISAVPTEKLDTMLQPTERKDLRENLQSNFMDGAKTFMAQSPTGLQSVATIMDQAEKLAVLYRSQGKDSKSAAKQAYDEVMGWKYDFVDSYRVPKTEYSTSLVQMGAQKALTDLDATQAFITPYSLSPGAAQQQTIDAIKANAYWVTNEDETGLELKVRGRDNGQYTVKSRDGNPVSMSFRDLSRLASSTISEEQLAAEDARRAAAERLRQGAR